MLYLVVPPLIIINLYFLKNAINSEPLGRETYSFIEIMQSISPNCNWENGVKQIRLLKKICHKGCILFQLLRTKTLASGSKCIRHFFIFATICIISAEWMWWISLMASLGILCFHPFNLKNKIMKIEHKKIFCGPSKILKNISWSITICIKYFVAPTKTLNTPPPFYILNVMSLSPK